MPVDDRDLIEMYWREAGARVGPIAEQWRSLVEDPTCDAGDTLLRTLHTMKGEAQMLDLQEVAELVTAMEDAVGDAKRGKAEEASAVFLPAVDAIAMMSSDEDEIPALLTVDALQARIRQTARRAAASLGKKIQIEVSADGSVDRALGPALLHLVRNAVDHAIEAPDVRLRAGKPAEGSIRVSVVRDGSSVCVEVSDDGAGVDRERLRERLAELDPSGVPHDDQELLQRIFEHGVTTRSETTELSGRGVGLDVVAEQVRTLGGTIQVESTPGAGTRFELRVPSSRLKRSD